jgi:septal ring factor EnvC (AmiA/AmiB activator)
MIWIIVSALTFLAWPASAQAPATATTQPSVEQWQAAFGAVSKQRDAAQSLQIQSEAEKARAETQLKAAQDEIKQLQSQLKARDAELARLKKKE